MKAVWEIYNPYIDSNNYVCIKLKQDKDFGNFSKRTLSLDDAENFAKDLLNKINEIRKEE